MAEYHKPLTCPCVLKQKPMCREGVRCWHFGNNRGTCDQCHCSGYLVTNRLPRKAGDV